MVRRTLSLYERSTEMKLKTFMAWMVTKPRHKRKQRCITMLLKGTTIPLHDSSLYRINRGYLMSVVLILNLFNEFNKFSNEPAEMYYYYYY